jgi:hypothetical protein
MGGVVAQRNESDRNAPIPLLQKRRGGCAIKKSCEATLDAQTGWSEMCLTTPSAPINGCLRRYFLEVASTPPLEEGNSSRFMISSCLRNTPYSLRLRRHLAPGIGSFVGIGPVYLNTINPPPLPSVRYSRLVSGSCQISRVCRTLCGSLGPAPGGTNRGDRK